MTEATGNGFHCDDVVQTPAVGCTYRPTTRTSICHSVFETHHACAYI